MGIDRISLQGWCIVFARILDHAIEERAREAVPPVSDAYREAEDRPDWKVVHGANRARPDQTRHLVAHTKAAPSGRNILHIREHSRNRRVLGLGT